ncbi:nucleotide exchange factor GrpE [Odoribacter sp. OttesenSCG-928-J03]|nr:nucleotide exchange factor GrpE [Odoribacter sp. OttesenSCG-928-J03]MDL2283149.1 nucleotide exchange factor GrpE [Odoribacter sp. OttesenSCG-928-G04]MDL2330505.1 nucleotide exchange factor GrpE [Odoribacter sp. OttesenSCG-928-A06]
MVDKDEQACDTAMDAEELKNEGVAEENVNSGDPVEELKLQLAALNDKYVRLSAEFDNYRKRTLKEKADMIKSAGEDVLLRILPVVDNFERALLSMEKSTDVEALYKGVELIYVSFKDFLAQNGVHEMDCVNQEFNMDEHEAITKIPAPSEDLKGKIVDCVQKGYTLNGKVMRFPKVVVGE